MQPPSLAWPGPTLRENPFFSHLCSPNLMTGLTTGTVLRSFISLTGLRTSPGPGLSFHLAIPCPAFALCSGWAGVFESPPGRRTPCLGSTRGGLPGLCQGASRPVGLVVTAHGGGRETRCGHSPPPLMSTFLCGFQ